MSDKTGSRLPEFPSRRSDPFAPPPAYEDWRQQAAATKVRLPDGREAWAVTRHEDVRSLLREADLEFLTADRLDPKFPNLRAGVIGLSTDSNIVFMDEPDHGRIRRMIAPMFTAKKAAHMRAGIQEIVETAVDRLLSAGPGVDLHQAFSQTIPSSVICQLLGVDYADHELFESLAGDLLSRSTSKENFAARLAELADYMSRAVGEKECAPDPNDFIGHLLVNHVAKGELTRQQVVGLSMLMIIGGHETTATTISMSVLYMLKHRQLWNDLRANPDVTAKYVEEFIRVQSINDLVTLRLAKKDFEIGGCPVKAGEGVFALGAAANHDPAVFPDPEKVDPSRNMRQHVGFGHGVHVCPGQSLARVELELALSTLARRVPELDLAVPEDSLRYRHDGFVFGVHELPVTWPAA